MNRNEEMRGQGSAVNESICSVSIAVTVGIYVARLTILSHKINFKFFSLLSSSEKGTLGVATVHGHLPEVLKDRERIGTATGAAGHIPDDATGNAEPAVPHRECHQRDEAGEPQQGGRDRRRKATRIQ